MQADKKCPIHSEAIKDDMTFVGYKLTRPDCGGWMFLGTEPAEVGKALAYELQSQDDLPADERGQIIIEAFEITQDEIDNMPEFPGW